MIYHDVHEYIMIISSGVQETNIAPWRGVGGGVPPPPEDFSASLGVGLYDFLPLSDECLRKLVSHQHHFWTLHAGLLLVMVGGWVGDPALLRFFPPGVSDLIFVRRLYRAQNFKQNNLSSHYYCGGQTWPLKSDFFF